MSIPKNLNDTKNQLSQESNEFVEISEQALEPLQPKDSSTIFETIKVNQPKPLVYSWLLKIIVFLGILGCVLVGSLALGNVFLEYQRPDFVEENMIGRNQTRRNDFDKMRPNQYSLEKRLMAISIEFVVITGLVIIGAFLIYRNTDGIFVKNKVFLIAVIAIAVILLGLLSMQVFSQNIAIPKAFREKRDGFRSLRGDKHPPRLDRIDQIPNNSQN
jgi:hypothetical protein